MFWKKRYQWLSNQRVSQLVFENTIFLLYTKEHFYLFLLLKVAYWVVQTFINASVEEPRSFVSDDVHDTTEGCRDCSPEEVYLLFRLSSETTGKAALILNTRLLACGGTSSLEFKKPVCSVVVSLLWYVWITCHAFVLFKRCGEMSKQESHEFQQKEMQCPAPGEE